MKKPCAIKAASCPACGNHVCIDFLDAEPQPLATIAWPDSKSAALELPRLPMDFVRCVDCGHVFNASFEYGKVPYSEKPNLMFNTGAIWSDFILDRVRAIQSRLPEKPVVVEVGYGDGHFLSALAHARPEGRYIGFDPNGAKVASSSIECRAELFGTDELAELLPHVVISRHVLEHLVNPLAFLQRLSFAATMLGIEPLAYLEVPCIDRVLDSKRTVDFYYEHSSHFTTSSFTRMLKRCGAGIVDIGHGYQGEVIYGFIRLGAWGTAMQVAQATEAYLEATIESRDTIRGQLDELVRAGRSVAIWGGTGKSAAFMCRYGLDADRFPIVVDSDRAKVGTYVPGTGQVIRSRDWLFEHPADVIIIPPQWRAADIFREMKDCGLQAGSVLIEHQGRLIDFMAGGHPYL